MSSTTATGSVTMASECRSGSPWKPGTEGTRKSSTANTTRQQASPELRDERRWLQARVAGPDGHREAEDEQDVRDDASRERAADDVRQSVADREDGDDQLGRVAEARVQEPADARPGVF